MKRVISIMLAIILCLAISLPSMAAPKATPAPKFKVTISYSAKLVSNDHVGNSWTTNLQVGKSIVKKGKTLTLEVSASDKIKIVCNATENDKIPDNGSATITVAAKDLKKGKNTYKATVEVTENRGRYSGNKAEWAFTVTVKK